MNWIDCKERLPESGRKVLATYKNGLGNARIIVAERFNRWEHEAGCEEECASEYSEEKDEYFYLEGWYEQQDNWGEYSSIYVSEGEVTHWMPLPDPQTGYTLSQQERDAIGAEYRDRLLDELEDIDCLGQLSKLLREYGK